MSGLDDLEPGIYIKHPDGQVGFMHPTPTASVCHLRVDGRGYSVSIDGSGWPAPKHDAGPLPKRGQIVNLALPHHVAPVLAVVDQVDAKNVIVLDLVSRQTHMAIWSRHSPHHRYAYPLDDT